MVFPATKWPIAEKDLESLQMALGLYSKKQFDERPVNEDEQDLDDAFASEKVVKRVWEKLSEIYKPKDEK